jgi:hypothetical protein
MKKNSPRNPKLVLHQETLRRLDQDDLHLVIGQQSAASVCHENTKPECGAWSLDGGCGVN